MPTPLGEHISLQPSHVIRNLQELRSPSGESGRFPLQLLRRPSTQQTPYTDTIIEADEDEGDHDDYAPLLGSTSAGTAGPSKNKQGYSSKRKEKRRPPSLKPPVPQTPRDFAAAGAAGQAQAPLASSTSIEFESLDLHSARRTPMPKKSPAAAANGKASNPTDVKKGGGDSTGKGKSAANGHASGAMTPMLEERQRRRNLSIDASHAANIFNHDTFSLDKDPLLQTPKDGAGGSSAGFMELPVQDRRNFLLLVLLYFLQGVPMGLASGSVPFLLKSHLSYGQIGIFSLASYPYSLKLLWSPIVDAVWDPRLGRRKSWIVPIQALSGVGMLWLGGHVEEMMANAGKNGGEGVWGFTSWWFFLVFMCATQDIAVDGWALTLLSPQNLSYASTAQTVGLVGGQFLSHTVFLAFNAPDFANKWFRSQPRPEGVLTLGGYLTFWGWFYIFVTIGLAVLKQENRARNSEGIREVYHIMGKIMSLRNIQIFIFIHLIAKIGFIANDAVTNLKLLDKGLSQEDLALTVLIDFPFEVSLGYYVGKWSSIYPPMHLWCYAFIGRVAAAVFAQITVASFPAVGVTGPYLLLVIAQHLFSTFMNTVMFVTVSAFHAKIADPLIGGTYMTLLATCSNLGGTFPRFFVLKFVDLFTKATCFPPAAGGTKIHLKEGATAITAPFSCALEADKHLCIDGGGVCQIERDGYYVVNACCIILAIISFVWFIKPQAYKLQQLPLRAWRIS